MNKLPSITIRSFIRELMKLNQDAYVKAFGDDVELGVALAGEILEASGNIHTKKGLIMQARQEMRDSIAKRFTK